VMHTVSGSSRPIVVHIGSKDGFLPGAQLAYKANSMSGDNHGQKNYHSSSDESHTKSFPTCCSAVLWLWTVCLTTTVHSKPTEKYASKQDVVDWL
jgi:hypothetical protein